ncbi:MAG: hypothetical protein QM728_03260 [Gordonia sp. (in: high G+C Gram-positive bacteria)]|uniref:gephyrin-like molybdotransferase receptor GlpR n=1 Tax=Gordonia sp. (in: high G+C Gram-positive bacteria) TaxID=84139 RepID=UPI0039E6D130
MPNSVLWVCLVAIWLFVLVPMVIQGRPELRKSTPVAAATRVLKRGEDAVRRRRIGAGAHPHDPSYKPKTSASIPGDLDDLEELPLTTPLGEEPVIDLADDDAAEVAAVDPNRIPGKVLPRQRRTARTVAARMRRVVDVTINRWTDDVETEVIPVVDEDVTEVISKVGADDEVTEVISKVSTRADGAEDAPIIDAEVVDDDAPKAAADKTKRGKGKKPRTHKVDVIEVQAVEVIDVEIEDAAEQPTADESPTEKIDKVDDAEEVEAAKVDEKVDAKADEKVDAKAEKADDVAKTDAKADKDEKADKKADDAEDEAATLFDVDDVDGETKAGDKADQKPAAVAEPDDAEPAAGEAVAETEDDDEESVAAAESTADDAVAETGTVDTIAAKAARFRDKVKKAKAARTVAKESEGALEGGLDLDAKLEPIADADTVVLAADTSAPKAPWDDEIDPNEMTQVLVARRGRGGYDPEVDKERLDLKYKERQRVLLTLLGLTVLAIIAGVVLGTIGWIATGVMAFGVVAYLFFLRRAVRSETQIRKRRLARLERTRREQVARRRNEFVERPEVLRAPSSAPRPRMRRPDGMTVVQIDDEDPEFDYLPTYRAQRAAGGDHYRTAAVS